MLKRVVEDEHIVLKMLDCPGRAGKPVRVTNNRSAPVEVLGQEKWLVAGFIHICANHISIRHYHAS